MSVATYSQSRSSQKRAPHAFAAPTSRTRSPRPSRMYRSRRTWNECPFARQFGSSQPRWRLTNGSTRSTSSSGSYQPSAFAFSSHPSASRSFSGAPGRSGWSMSGMPFGARPNVRPQPVHRRSPSSRTAAPQTGQRRSSRRAVMRPNTVLTALRYAAPVTVAVAALAALPASLLTIRGLLHTPAARHVVAAPRADRWHTRSTPLLGGSGIFAGLLVAAGVALAAGLVPASRELG